MSKTGAKTSVEVTGKVDGKYSAKTAGRMTSANRFVNNRTEYMFFDHGSKNFMCRVGGVDVKMVIGSSS